MMAAIPDFTMLDLSPANAAGIGIGAQDAWRRAFEAESGKPIGTHLWQTP